MVIYLLLLLHVELIFGYIVFDWCVEFNLMLLLIVIIKRSDCMGGGSQQLYISIRRLD